MDGPRPLEALWFDVRDKLVTRLPTINPEMLEALHGAFYAGAAALALTLTTDGGLSDATRVALVTNLPVELDEFLKRRA